MNLPLVTVCIATYNQDSYIKDCIVSVLSQHTDISIEILIGDDGSGPETPKIIERLSSIYPGVIRYFKHKINLGPSENYKFLIKEARGCYLAHLDGDDFWLPGKLFDQINWMESNPASVACYTNAIVVNDAQELYGVFSSKAYEYIDFKFLLQYGNFLNQSSMLYRGAYKKIILDFDGPYLDYKIHLNFAKISQLGFINKASVVYRMGSAHSMIRTTPDLVMELYFKALVSVLNDSNISKSLRNQALINFWRSIAIEIFAKGKIAWGINWAHKIKACNYESNGYIFTIGSFFALRAISNLVAKRILQNVFGINKLKVLHEL